MLTGSHLDHGGQMLVTLAGAMSTAELGLSLAEMIREGKVHAISCTGANLEEDIFNLVAKKHTSACRSRWKRTITAGTSRTTASSAPRMRRSSWCGTSTVLPTHAFPRRRPSGRLESALLNEWRRADNEGRTRFPTRIPLPDPACRHAQGLLRQPREQLGASRRAERPADVCSRLGGTPRSATPSRATSSAAKS